MGRRSIFPGKPLSREVCCHRYLEFDLDTLEAPGFASLAEVNQGFRGQYSCYTDPVKNVTISLDEELAHWARRKAADENTSVSKLVARLLDREMRASDKYWKAYEQWKKLDIKLDASASNRFTREEAHERR